MSMPTAPIAPAPPPSAPSSSNAATAGNIAQSAGLGTSSESNTVSTMSDIKRKSPKLYQAMMQGIAMNICNTMRDSQDRLKEMWRKARQS